MKRKISLIIISLVFSVLASSIFAAEPTNFQNYELDVLLHGIEKPCAPVITDDYIIFTADVRNRHVGIAFDFENYNTVHPFQILTDTDDDGVVTRRHMFYCYKRQHKFTSITYRLIIDGLWTTDPLNPNKIYDENTNLYFSKIEDPGSIAIYTSKTESDTIHFIYKGDSGKLVHLAGTFTNWDPWIYELKETSPGLYELDLPLPSGKYYYSYYIGLTQILDNTNPEKVYSADGRIANVIVVD